MNRSISDDFSNDLDLPPSYIDVVIDDSNQTNNNQVTSPSEEPPPSYEETIQIK